MLKLLSHNAFLFSIDLPSMITLKTEKIFVRVCVCLYESEWVSWWVFQIAGFTLTGCFMLYSTAAAGEVFTIYGAAHDWPHMQHSGHVRGCSCWNLEHATKYLNKFSGLGRFCGEKWIDDFSGCTPLQTDIGSQPEMLSVHFLPQMLFHPSCTRTLVSTLWEIKQMNYIPKQSETMCVMVDSFLHRQMTNFGSVN